MMDCERCRELNHEYREAISALSSAVAAMAGTVGTSDFMLAMELAGKERKACERLWGILNGHQYLHGASMESSQIS
jgi:hypothetical protein